LLRENNAFFNFFYFDWIHCLVISSLRGSLVSMAYYTCFILFQFIEFSLQVLYVLSD
jgi:hypothetical protein